MRQLRLRMSDDTVRSVMVDENQPVANLMVILCTKLGITNHDEYSLIATGKHTINGRRRDKGIEGRVIDQKMEQLKKKLKTDEDLAWVDHSKTLDEQEIHEQDVVLLRRRFFYSDHIVDTRDPIQLGLLYVQTRDAILSGTHPVAVDGACRFAGLQCQAQLGDFAETKTTRPGYINLKDYLPAEYAKQKNVERKIWVEHRRHLGMGELEAKAAYVQEARALPTYGVTFFLVKEKVTGKNRLVPRLLGITKDSVLRVDADTKAILKQWPLTTVKRWAASKNSFTLDFGDYSDSYYSVQTTEGEQISQLIAGYIDIILRRRKAKDHFGIEGDEGATMIEDSVAPSRATIIKNQTRQRPQPPSPVEEPPVNNWTRTADGVDRRLIRTGPIVEPGEFRPAVEVQGKAEIGYEARPATQYVASYEPSPPQRDFQERLDQAQEAVEEAQKVLDRSETTLEQQQHLMADNMDRDALEQKKRRLSNQFAEINAATAQLVSLSAIPEEELNYPALNTAVETVAHQLPTLAEDVRLVATLMDDECESERLIEAARKLCKAFSDLLSAAEPGPTVPRQSLISAASRVGDATQALLYTVQANAHDQESADLLLSSAKTVASSAAALVLKAKDIATWCKESDPPLGNQVIGSATQCALATSQMVATAKIVAPTIHDTNCQKKLIDSCREVERAVGAIRVSCQRALRDDEQQLCELQESVRRVTSAVEELLEQVRNVKYNNQLQLQQQQQRNNSTRQQRQNQQTTTTSTTSTTQRIVQVECEDHDDHEDRSADEHTAESQDPNKSELVKQARTLARATTQLIQDMRPEQQQQPHQSSYHGNSYPNEQFSSEHRIRVESDEIEREEPPTPRQHHNKQQQQQQQQQQTTTTTTITTTVFDERDERERPVSQYEYEQQSLGQNHDEQSTNHYSSIEHQQQVIRDKETRPDSSDQDELPEATISGIVGDLETTIMFATAGTLRAQDQHESYLYHREHVLECAKALVEDTRPLVASASSDHAQLAQAAQESVMTMARLAEAVKSSAATLGPNNAEGQAGLIRSVKEVAESLSELIGSTKSALGCEPYDQRLVQVKESAKGMVGSVTSLLRTVKSVEEEQQRGLRAIEVALDAIDQELADYEVRCSEQVEEAGGQQQQRAQVDELARMSRPVSMATAKTVHAASSGLQDDAIVAANMGRKAIVDLLRSTCSAGQQADSYELRSRIQEAGRNCAVNYKRLLELLHRIFQHPSIAAANPDFKQELISQSKTIASCVVELESCNHQQSLIISQRKVPGIAQEISACEQILRKEKELEVAKTQLIALRKAKYSNRPDDYKGYGGSLE